MWLVSMFPTNKEYICGLNIVIHFTMTSLCVSQTEAVFSNNGAWFILTLKSHSITPDGSDGVIDIILSVKRGVHIHHLKVHRNAAKPSKWWQHNSFYQSVETATAQSHHLKSFLKPVKFQCISLVLTLAPLALFAYLKSSLTWLSSSGPIPSPGMRVTVCRPPYFAGGGWRSNQFRIKPRPSFCPVYLTSHWRVLVWVLSIMWIQWPTSTYNNWTLFEDGGWKERERTSQ